VGEGESGHNRPGLRAKHGRGLGELLRRRARADGGGLEREGSCRALLGGEGSGKGELSVGAGAQQQARSVRSFDRPRARQTRAEPRRPDRPPQQAQATAAATNAPPKHAARHGRPASSPCSCSLMSAGDLPPRASHPCYHTQGLLVQESAQRALSEHSPPGGLTTWCSARRRSRRPPSEQGFRQLADPPHEGRARAQSQTGRQAMRHARERQPDETAPCACTTCPVWLID